MKTFTFTEEEQQLLVEILDKEIPSLRDEIVHTDDHDYREFLKEREASQRLGEEAQRERLDGYNTDSA